ncbi:MAG: T9SS type A sorting domain-containing protein, partial [Bacteroidales bacterium]|nr:T9SS type A sorting domain-containing protein [Bacteroidales bacterium]
YVENDGGRYGVMSYDENTTEVELCFHANRMGSYTIGIEPDGKFKSVTLIDKFTGIETNMLVEDYNFTATSGDNVNRFIVKLAVSDQQSAVSDNFVYQSGEELIVEAEGRVQIIDVMGRVVYSDDVESTNNRINVSDFGDGTYVVRVINETEVKVEKVVIY